MTEAEEACPHDQKETAVEALKIRGRIPTKAARGSARARRGARGRKSTTVPILSHAANPADCGFNLAALRPAYPVKRPRARREHRHPQGVEYREELPLDRDRLNWAESEPTGVVSGRTGVRAKAVFPSRARNSLHHPRDFGCATLDESLRKAASLHQGQCADRYRIQFCITICTAKKLKPERQAPRLEAGEARSRERPATTLAQRMSGLRLNRGRWGPRLGPPG